MDRIPHPRAVGGQLRRQYLYTIRLGRSVKNILVTNDDGVLAPGLLALAQEMQKLGKVTILAPDRNWSGGGHVKTLDRALRVREFHLEDGTQAFGSDGAPSDCVALSALG